MTPPPEPLRLPKQAMPIARTVAGQDAPRIVVHESDACQGNITGWGCADCDDDACECECHFPTPHPDDVPAASKLTVGLALGEAAAEGVLAYRRHVLRKAAEALLVEGTHGDLCSYGPPGTCDCALGEHYRWLINRSEGETHGTA